MKRQSSQFHRLLKRFSSLLLLLVVLCAPASAQTNNNNNTPQEKDVALVTTTPVCSRQILLDADISGNHFISRAEYVNLLLDVAPPDCPIIDAWLNDEPLQRVFEELSCLCHEFGGVDGEANCCLQAVGVPMLAAFATPDNPVTNYPEEYAALACAKIDTVVAEQCGSPTTTSSGSAGVTDPPTLAPTLAPSSAPTVTPTVAASEEETHVGGILDITFVDGDIEVEEELVEYDDDDSAGTNNDDKETDQDIQDDMEADIHETQDDLQQQQDDESTTTTSNGTESQDDIPQEPMVGPTPEATDPPQDVPTTALEDQPIVVDTSSRTPVGVILAALLVTVFCLTLAGVAIWAKRQQLFPNPWKSKQQSEVDSNLSFTKDENEEDDSDDNDSDACIGEDLPTPIRSNTRSHSFSSDDGDSTDEDSDLERPASGRRAIHMATAGMSSSRTMKDGVVRAEFQDDLSVWGRRKRRKSERQQRREERRRASLEEVAPERKSNMGSILSTLELDLHGGMERPSSSHSLASASTTVEGGALSPAALNTTDGDHLALDIFDDASDSSSYAGSPQNAHDALPLETSIEDWLASNAMGAGVVAGGDDRSVSSKLSVASSKVSTGSFSKRGGVSMTPPKQPLVQRQPKDPVLQDWNAQRQHQQPGSPQKLGFGSFPVAPLSPSRNMQQRPSNFSSPTASPKPYASSHSVPASPADRVMVLQETLSLHSRSHSESSFPCMTNGETKHADTPPYEMKSFSLTRKNAGEGQEVTRPQSLDLPTEESLHSGTTRPAPRLSPESQEFYETILQMEPSEEDDSSRGNAFAFEAARPREAAAPERYLV